MKNCKMQFSSSWGKRTWHICFLLRQDVLQHLSQLDYQVRCQTRETHQTNSEENETIRLYKELAYLWSVLVVRGQLADMCTWAGILYDIYHQWWSGELQKAVPSRSPDKTVRYADRAIDLCHLGMWSSNVLAKVYGASISGTPALRILQLCQRWGVRGRQRSDR